MADLCQEYKIKYYKTDDMKEAVAKIFEIMEENDKVLLSPASASWDMYNSYAERGDDFKKLLLKYELENLWK